jgi:hypothetical protein
MVQFMNRVVAKVKRVARTICSGYRGAGSTT